MMLLDCNGGDCQQQKRDLADHGFRVLALATKPDYLSDAEFERQKEEADSLFHHLTDVALNYCPVRVAVDPNSYSYVYPLALAYLNASPPEIPKGIFFMARAASLSPVDVRKKLEDYGREQYEKYHGSAQGWTDVLRLAKENPQVPSGFTIAPAR